MVSHRTVHLLNLFGRFHLMPKNLNKKTPKTFPTILLLGLNLSVHLWDDGWHCGARRASPGRDTNDFSEFSAVWSIPNRFVH